MTAAEPWSDLPEWRDAAAYADLRHSSHSAFAWEWLRRNRAYRAAAAAHPASVWEYENIMVARGHPAAARWGLHAFASPCLSYAAARPVWTAEWYPFVLAASADAAMVSPADQFALESIDLPETIVRDPRGAEHLLIFASPGEIRLDIVRGSLFAGSVELHYLLSGLAGVEPPLLVLRRLVALWRSGRVPATLAPAPRRGERLTLLLRAHDADRAGANQREIAAVLLSRGAKRQRWRTEDPSLRSRAQRLVGAARRMPFNYRQLLT